MSKKKQKQKTDDGRRMMESHQPSIREFLTKELYRIFNQHPNRPFNYKQLGKLIGHPPHPPKGGFASDEWLKDIPSILNELAHKGDLLETERGKYKLKPKHAYMEGIIDIKGKGMAYLLTENNEDDIYIAPGNIHNALHGDRVKIVLYAKHRDRRLEGEVVEVLQRSKTEFVGKVQLLGRYAFVVPDSPKMLVDIFIPETNINEAKDGQKVIVKIADWPRGSKNPIGKIIKLLGAPGENDVEMNSILAEFGFPLEFPEQVEDEARAIADSIDPREIAKRRDFRTVTTFTIDPVDAKDFDDALSIRRVDDGRWKTDDGNTSAIKHHPSAIWEIGIHIADVAHYIRPGTFLDKEAYERGTSVYLVDRVIPMLPEKLSNGVCSLRPREDKLCFSAVFEMNDNAQVLKQWFGKTIIHSNKRFSYEEAQDVIETKKGPFSEEILTLQGLAIKLRAERFKKGAIAFEKAEVKFNLDEKGKPLGVYIKESKDSNKLIEEFMLLANRSVAESVAKSHTIKSEKTAKKTTVAATTIKVQGKPFVYRVHDGPVTDRLVNFARFASKWGYKVKTTNDKEISGSLNGLLKQLHGKKEQNVLEQLAIRTMSKAMYTTENIGHYGLAFDYYTHFTSPIRRYPDVLVHRLLEYYLQQQNHVDRELLEMQCKHSTQMEIRASEAERASIKYKQVEFLQDKIGQTFSGLISGVTEWGIFIELVENKCEGMIRLRDLDDDFYEFDEVNYRVVGTRTGKYYTLGDEVKVQVMRCDLLKKQIDFKMIYDEATNKERLQRPAAKVGRERNHKSEKGKRSHFEGKKRRR